MNPPKISNLKVTERTSIVNGKSVTEMIYQFSVDDHGPFTLNFDKATFDPVKAKTALNDFAQKLAASFP